MKAASRQFAEGHGVPGVNRRESMWLHVSDFMKVSRSKCCIVFSIDLIELRRVPLGRGERLHNYAAMHHEMLPCTNRNSDDVAA